MDEKSDLTALLDRRPPESRERIERVLDSVRKLREAGIAKGDTNLPINGMTISQLKAIQRAALR